jgi:hypothetical protein
LLGNPPSMPTLVPVFEVNGPTPVKTAGSVLEKTWLKRNLGMAGFLKIIL